MTTSCTNSDERQKRAATSLFRSHSTMAAAQHSSFSVAPIDSHSASVHPHLDLVWNSFFLSALLSAHAIRWSSFSKSAFPPIFDGFALLPEYSHLYLIFNGRRIVINTGDYVGFSLDDAKWCDVYAKTNLDWSTVPEQYRDKFIACGPFCPIRLPCDSYTTFLFSALLFHTSARLRIRHLRNLYRHIRDCHTVEALREDVPRKKRDIHFRSSLWKDSPQTNLFRSRFIAACKHHPDLRFEGGFHCRGGFQEYEHLMAPADQPRESKRDYLAKTKRSAFVFSCPSNNGNTPWRLGEYIAMGKAIILVPGKDLTTPLQHGVNAHFCDASEESIRAAVDRLARDDDYRLTLEQGARKYYFEHASPTQLMKRIACHNLG